eukprot:sb/3473254/
MPRYAAKKSVPKGPCLKRYRRDISTPCFALLCGVISSVDVCMVLKGTIIADRRLRLAGHAQSASRVHPPQSSTLGTSSSSWSSQTWQTWKTFVDVLRQDTGLRDMKELASVMDERDVWRKLVQVKCFSKNYGSMRVLWLLLLKMRMSKLSFSTT